VPIYEIPDSPKMLRETLCVAQSRIGNCDLDPGRKAEHIARLGRLIAECDRHRPLGPDGKHGERHTPNCGCDDVSDCLCATDLGGPWATNPHTRGSKGCRFDRCPQCGQEDVDGVRWTSMVGECVADVCPERDGTNCRP